MGMYDLVRYETTCYKCGMKLQDFQSQDGPRLLHTLEPIDVHRFYTNCESCDTWNEFETRSVNFLKWILKATTRIVRLPPEDTD